MSIVKDFYGVERVVNFENLKWWDVNWMATDAAKSSTENDLVFRIHLVLEDTRSILLYRTVIPRENKNEYDQIQEWMEENFIADDVLSGLRTRILKEIRRQDLDEHGYIDLTTPVDGISLISAIYAEEVSKFREKINAIEKKTPILTRDNDGKVVRKTVWRPFFYGE